MTLFITKADLPDFVKFSANIADNLINPDIRDAHEFDVLPLLSPGELAAITTYYKLPTADKAAYLALTEAEQEISPLYKSHQLFAVVRGLLCHESHRRYLLSAGLHNTPNGLEVISDVGHAPISTSQRTDLRGDAQSKCAIYRNKLVAAQRAFSGTPTRTACTSSRRRPGPGGLKSYIV